MGKKINVAELLKDCPSGMELDCSMYDNLFLSNVNENDLYSIMCYTICDGIRNTVVFTEFGEFNRFISSKCVIFPKGKTTWEGFRPPCKFKDGDRIKDKDNKEWFVGQVFETHFDISSVPNAEGYFVSIEDQDNYELVPDKFDIATLKPFDKVLVKYDKIKYWKVEIYSHYDEGMPNCPFCCIGAWYKRCIPYEGNEHLLGTSDECDDFYKNWK